MFFFVFATKYRNRSIRLTRLLRTNTTDRGHTRFPYICWLPRGANGQQKDVSRTRCSCHHSLFCYEGVSGCAQRNKARTTKGSVDHRVTPLPPPATVSVLSEPNLHTRLLSSRLVVGSGSSQKHGHCSPLCVVAPDAPKVTGKTQAYARARTSILPISRGRWLPQSPRPRARAAAQPRSILSLTK